MTSRDLQSREAEQGLRAWLDGLAGRPDAGGDAVEGAQQQGLLLRDLVMQRALASETAITSADDEAIERQWLLVRKRLASVADDSSVAPKSLDAGRAEPAFMAGAISRRAANRGLYAAAAAAGLASIAVAISLVWHSGTPGELFSDGEVVMRGAVEPIRVSAPRGTTPAALADRICRVLDSHQVRYLRVELQDATQLQFKLVAESGLHVELARMNVKVPASGPVNLLVVK